MPESIVFTDYTWIIIVIIFVVILFIVIGILWWNSGTVDASANTSLSDSGTGDSSVGVVTSDKFGVSPLATQMSKAEISRQIQARIESQLSANPNMTAEQVADVVANAIVSNMAFGVNGDNSERSRQWVRAAQDKMRAEIRAEVLNTPMTVRPLAVVDLASTGTPQPVTVEPVMMPMSPHSTHRSSTTPVEASMHQLDHMSSGSPVSLSNPGAQSAHSVAVQNPVSHGQTYDPSESKQAHSHMMDMVHTLMASPKSGSSTPSTRSLSAQPEHSQFSPLVEHAVRMPSEMRA